MRKRRMASGTWAFCCAYWRIAGVNPSGAAARGSTAARTAGAGPRNVFAGDVSMTGSVKVCGRGEILKRPELGGNTINRWRRWPQMRMGGRCREWRLQKKKRGQTWAKPSRRAGEEPRRDRSDKNEGET